MIPLKLYQEVFRHFPLALALLDETGRLLFANDSFSSFCSTAQETVCGRKASEVLPFFNFHLLLSACLQQQQTRRGEFPLTTTPGGGVSMVQVTLTPLFLSRGAGERRSGGEINSPSPPCPSAPLPFCSSIQEAPLPGAPTFLLLLEDISEKVRWEEQLLQV